MTDWRINSLGAWVKDDIGAEVWSAQTAPGSWCYIVEAANYATSRVMWRGFCATEAAAKLAAETDHKWPSRDPSGERVGTALPRSQTRPGNADGDGVCRAARPTP